MSAGAFTISRYEADYGDGTNIHPIKVQPETIDLATNGGTAETNAPPVAGITNPISAECASGYRCLGLHPRKVRMRLTGVAPAGYAPNSLVVLPLLNKAIAANLTPGTEMTYLGVTWVVVGTHPEGVK